MKILETQYGEDFVGREYDIEEGKKKIRENGVVVLTGNRGIGKTNLMRVLERFFKDYRECHYIESSSLFLEEISRIFLPKKVRTGFSVSIGGFGFGINNEPRELQLLEYMEKSKEMIVFVENAHDLKKEDIEIIFAGTGRNNKLKFVLEIANPDYNSAELRISPEQLFELGKLGESDIVKIVEKECPDFTEEVVKRIVSRSIGYPYIARSLAYICEKKESEPEMLDFLNTLKDAKMEHTLNKIHKEVLTTLEKDARELIKKLALAPPVLTLPLIEAFCGGDADTPLGEVIDRGVLKNLESDYVIYHPLFRDYLQKRQRISHKNKRKIYLEAMEKVKSEPDLFYLLLEVLDETDIFKDLVEIAENYYALNSIGEQSYVWGKINEATFAWSRLLKLADDKKDKNCISVATGNMGIIYRIQGDMEKALEHYEKALEIHTEIGNKLGMTSALGNMGIIYRIQGDMEKALEHYEKALEIDYDIGNKQGMANQLGNMGVVYQIQGDMTKALEHHQKALEIDDEIENKQGMANQLGNMGVVYQTQGDMEKALEYHQKALEIDDQIGNKQGMATALGNMGIVYEMQKDMEKALEHHQKALEIDDQIGNKQGMARNLGNIGIIYKTQGSMKKALEHHQKALKIDEEIGDKQGMASDYNNIAAIYEKRKDIQKVLEHLKKGLELFKDIGDKPHQAKILMNIGIVLINKGEKSIALDYYFDAQEIAEDYTLPLLEEINGRINGLLETQ